MEGLARSPDEVSFVEEAQRRAVVLGEEVALPEEVDDRAEGGGEEELGAAHVDARRVGEGVARRGALRLEDELDQQEELAYLGRRRGGGGLELR